MVLDYEQSLEQANASEREIRLPCENTTNCFPLVRHTRVTFPRECRARLRVHLARLSYGVCHRVVS